MFEKTSKFLPVFSSKSCGMNTNWLWYWPRSRKCGGSLKHHQHGLKSFLKENFFIMYLLKLCKTYKEKSHENVYDVKKYHKKVFQTFDNILNGCLMRWYQKYAKNWNILMAYWGSTKNSAKKFVQIGQIGCTQERSVNLESNL